MKIDSIETTHVINTDELKANYDDYKVVDVRADEEYDGETLYGEAKGGHLPGAIHIRYTDLFQKSGMLKSNAEITKMFEDAGITKDGLLMRMKKEDFTKVIDINLVGTFNMTRNVIPFMIKKRSGRIINVSSVVGITGNAGQTNYSASKAGVIGFTKSLAKEVASRNILVNAIAPGFIATDMTSVLSDAVKENINSQIPLNRMGSPKEIAKVVKFLASEDSSYITGQVINIDGGMVM